MNLLNDRSRAVNAGTAAIVVAGAATGLAIHHGGPFTVSRHLDLVGKDATRATHAGRGRRHLRRR